ncbi:GTPase ObgE [soil metagenome]
MASSNFIDYVKICSRSGHGGAGSAHLHRDKKNAKGGPDGGDGGRGGHIILRGNAQLWTLLHLKYLKHVIAKPGLPGSSGHSTGAQGEDVVLEVPIGTIARHAETNELKGEITADGQELILTPGGRGGLGNAHFKSATNQTPRYAQSGEEGKEEWVILELKILADVGLVGFPNAGKSTLLSVLSAATPKIADYPFTTLTPNLGVVPYRDYRSFVMADIPGIIEGASEGKGIGIRFLKHIERNSILLFMIAVDSKDIGEEYRILLRELESFNPELLDKKRLLALTKSDLIDAELEAEIKQTLPQDLPVLFISSITQKNLTQLKDMIWEALQ